MSASSQCDAIILPQVGRTGDHTPGKVAPDDANMRYQLIPKATLARRRRTQGRRLSREESDRVARLARI